jgi:phosphate transport system protein
MPVPARRSFTEELEQLKLQVELMAVRVSEALDKMRVVLATGDRAVARSLIDCDDEIDRMHVSLTERCYEVLVREQPMATDLRLVVSVIRVLGELERIGDLALRIAKLAPVYEDLSRDARVLAVLDDFAAEVVRRFGVARTAWATGDRRDLDALEGSYSLDEYSDRVASLILGLKGPGAVPAAVAANTAARSLDRIGDHAAIIGARVQYLLTGDPRYLATEV